MFSGWGIFKKKDKNPNSMTQDLHGGSSVKGSNLSLNPKLTEKKKLDLRANTGVI